MIVLVSPGGIKEVTCANFKKVEAQHPTVKKEQVPTKMVSVLSMACWRHVNLMYGCESWAIICNVISLQLR